MTRLFHQTKRTLLILSYKDLADESVKPLLISFARYEPNHETLTFSINDVIDFTAYLVDVSTAVWNLKYDDNTSKPAIWLRRFMKKHKADYVKVS